MKSVTQPLGRLPFFVGVSVVNIIIFAAVIIALTFRPAGGGHMAVLIVVGALQALWFNLHSRRFADAGRGHSWPLVMLLLCFGSFAIGYLTLAALWSSPDIQREAFRTAGGLAGGGMVDHIETNAFVIEGGNMIVSAVGLAGGVILSGFVIFGMAIASLVSVGFSFVALALSGVKVRTVGVVQGLNFRKSVN